MLLALDTSTRSVGIALYKEARVLGEVVWASQSYHTVELAPAIDELLHKTGVQNTSLEAIGVAIGPGSFTALRIGLAYAKGLAFSRRIPLIGIPTLNILAQAQPMHIKNLAAILQAGRTRLAVGWYQKKQRHWHPVEKLENLTSDEFLEKLQQPTWVCGELTPQLRQRLAEEVENVDVASPAQSVRRPAILAELAWTRWQAGEIDAPEMLSPIYLHHGEPIPG